MIFLKEKKRVVQLVGKMVHLKLLLQIVILAITFNICTPECVTVDKGDTAQPCSNSTCIFKKDLISLNYKCINTNLAEIYQDIKANLNLKITINASQSTIPALEPNSQSWNGITQFNLDHTNTSQIVPEFFKTFDDLQVLEITNNKLKEVDGVFSSTRNILKLNLSSNFIKKLTERSFSGLVNLRILDLSNNKIAIISNEVFRSQTSLEIVSLSQNLLKGVGDLFSETRSLKEINLSKNHLIDFNFLQLKDHKMLERLDLSENLLENITKISFTDINDESRESFFSILFSNTRVTFNMSHNFLKTISNNFCSLNVHDLDLSYNQISEISPNSFQNCIYLAFLYLQHNNIKELPIETFTNVTYLTYLDLSFNSITKISYGLFNNVYGLSYLDLSENHMLLDFHTLIHLNMLTDLKLQNNTIENFSPIVLLQAFRMLSSISLGKDVLNCTNLAVIIHLIQSKNITIDSGKNTKTNNILGYSCKDSKDLQEEDITFNRSNQISSLDNIGKEISLATFFNEDFKNTTFYKFFENFTQDPQSKSYVTSEVSKNAFIQYLNENFTETKFYKYLENLRSFENKSSEVIVNSTILNIGNTTSVDQNIKKLLVPFDEMNQNVKSLLIVQNATLNNLVGILSSSNKLYCANLVMSIVLAILLLISVLSFTYYIFWKFKRHKSITYEDVQLLQTQSFNITVFKFDLLTTCISVDIIFCTYN